MVQIPRYINVEVTGCIGMTATCGWQPPAPSSCTNVYSRRQKEPNNFPPRSPKGEPGSESMDGGAGRGGAAGDGGFLRSVFANLFRFRSGEKGEVRGRGGCVGVGVRPRKCRMGEGGRLTSWLFAFDEWGRKKKKQVPA